MHAMPKVRKGDQILWSWCGVGGGFWPLCGCHKSNQGPLEEQPVLITTEPPLQPQIFFLSRNGCAWWCTPLIPALGKRKQVDLWVWGQSGLCGELQNSQGYIEKPCLKTITTKTTEEFCSQGYTERNPVSNTTTTNPLSQWETERELT